MARRRTLVQEVMEEVILYGGLPARRCDVYDHALKVLRTHPVSEQQARRAADAFAFGLATRLAPADALPLTLAQLEALP